MTNDINARLDRAAERAKAVDRLIAKIDEREACPYCSMTTIYYPERDGYHLAIGGEAPAAKCKKEISCGTVEGHGVKAEPRSYRGTTLSISDANDGEAAKSAEIRFGFISKGQSGYQAPPAGIDLRTTPERAVDKYWAKYLLEIQKLQRAVDGIAVKKGIL